MSLKQLHERHPVKPHRIHSSHKISEYKSTSPAPNHYDMYKVNHDLISKRIHRNVKFGKAKRFSYRRASAPPMGRTKHEEGGIKRLSDGKPLGWSPVTTKPFERNPSTNVGAFSKSKRYHGNTSFPNPGPMRYRFDESFNKLWKLGNIPVSFSKSKRDLISSKIDTPSPLKYKVNLRHSSFSKRAPRAVFMMGGRKEITDTAKTPGPKYSPKEKLVIRAPPRATFGKSTRYPPPCHPTPAPSHYSPSYRVVQKQQPRTVLYLYG